MLTERFDPTSWPGGEVVADDRILVAVNDSELIGKTVAGRYRVTEKIGSGGMGAVYAALQEPLGRKVALKVLKPTFARDEIAVARFKKEAAIVSGLNHPNIVTLHDFGETEDGLLYIVMEYLRGRTLTSVRRSRTGVMPWRRTIPLMQDIVRALSAAHAAGIIHRDLKLDNIMLIEGHGERDFVKILDFGVAKTLAADDGVVPLTVTDSSPGTPGYMSPELARGMTDDPRSDFYALGVVWFELLVGARPFTDKNAMDLFFAQMTRPAPRIREVSPHLEVPEAIDALIQRLLDKDPNGRPRDTKAFLDATLDLEQSLLDTSRGWRNDFAAPKEANDAQRSDTSPDPQTVPTVSPVFMPTQLGGAPPFTDAGAPLPIEDVALTLTMTSPIIEPAESSVATVPHVSVAQPSAPRRARPLLAAATALGIVALAVVVTQTRDRDDDDAIVADVADAQVAPPPVFNVVVPRARGKPAAQGADVAPASVAPKVRAPGVRSSAVAEVPAPPAPAPPALPAAAEAPAQPREAAAPSEAPTAEASASRATPSEDALRRRLAAVTELMRDRMLLPDDVPNSRVLSAQVKDALDAARLDDAAATLTKLEAALSSVRLNDAFIRQKLARINAAFPSDWPRDPGQVEELRRLRTDVHERFGARDLPSTNLALNRLWLFALKGRMQTQK